MLKIIYCTSPLALALFLNLPGCAHATPPLPEMVTIPAGQFVMGCSEKEKPPITSDTICDVSTRYAAQKFSFSEFQMGKYEITVKQYQACVDDGACAPPLWQQKDKNEDLRELWQRTFSTLAAAGVLDLPNHPIVGVRWVDARDYTRWLRTVTGQYYRLPTEAEWEYAARGGGGQRSLYVNDLKFPITLPLANCRNQSCKDRFEYTSPVGSFSANGYGLHDMQGNVEEWCRGTKAAEQPDDFISERSHNPVGIYHKTGAHWAKGGSWEDLLDGIYAPDRNYHGDSGSSRYYLDSVGFRVVISFPTEGD